MQNINDAHSLFHHGVTGLITAATVASGGLAAKILQWTEVITPFASNIAVAVSFVLTTWASITTIRWMRSRVELNEEDRLLKIAERKRIEREEREALNREQGET